MNLYNLNKILVAGLFLFAGSASLFALPQSSGKKSKASQTSAEKAMEKAVSDVVKINKDVIISEGNLPKSKKDMEKEISESEKDVINKNILLPLEARYPLDEAIAKYKKNVEEHRAFQIEKLGKPTERFQYYYETFFPVVKNYKKYNVELLDIVARFWEFTDAMKSDTKSSANQKVSAVKNRIEKFRQGEVLKQGSKTESLPFAYFSCYLNRENGGHSFFLDDRIDEINRVLAGLNNYLAKGGKTEGDGIKLLDFDQALDSLMTIGNRISPAFNEKIKKLPKQRKKKFDKDVDIATQSEIGNIANVKVNSIISGDSSSSIADSKGKKKSQKPKNADKGVKKGSAQNSSAEVKENSIAPKAADKSSKPTANKKAKGGNIKDLQDKKANKQKELRDLEKRIQEVTEEIEDLTEQIEDAQKAS